MSAAEITAAPERQRGRMNRAQIVNAALALGLLSEAHFSAFD